MTINTLFELCKSEIEKGNGGNDILICLGENLGGYIPLEYGFSSVAYNGDDVYDALEWNEMDEETTTILN